MKNKLLLISVVVISLFTLTGCFGKEKEESKINKEAALEFKTSYESLNGKTNASGKEHRTVTINEENPFVTTTAEEIVKKIENKETFYVYFGDKLCPWCRSVVEKAVELANNNNIYTVYYVPIWDDEGNEILRDKYIVNAKGNLEKTIEGTEAYYKLLEYFDSFLRDYTLKNGNKTIMSGEKRIYAPNFMYVENGVLTRMTTGKSERQMDSREELTAEMLRDEEEAFKTFYLGEACSLNEAC